jgi:hypothetical protein
MKPVEKLQAEKERHAKVSPASRASSAVVSLPLSCFLLPNKVVEAGMGQTLVLREHMERLGLMSNEQQKDVYGEGLAMQQTSRHIFCASKPRAFALLSSSIPKDVLLPSAIAHCVTHSQPDVCAQGPHHTT